MAGGKLSDRDLWSLVDRGDGGLDVYLEQHPSDRERVEGLRSAIAAASGPRAEPVPPSTIASYRILGVLGRGGMGVVYEARQASPDRVVALKVLRSPESAGPRELALFQRESEALARLAHPHIAAIFEAGHTEHGQPFFAMELVRGRPLSEHARAEELPLRARLELFETLCRTVHHAHRHGVLHRDLKSSNVLVDGDGRLRVLDFGLARVQGLEASLLSSRGGGPLGTLPYMSPEQARGDPRAVDERSDVYSLGVVLHELLTGRLPIDLSERPLPEAVRAICEEAPARLGRRDRALRGQLEVLAAKALEKDPARRYGSAEALADDVRRWLDGQPIQARRPSVGYRLWKLYRRNLLVASLTGMLLLVLSFATFNALFPSATGLWSRGLEGSWLATRSPFEGLRWEGETPQVQVGGRWYRLLAIDDVDIDFILGFCRQNESLLWRKRFSEDLLQVLHRVGVWAWWDVDLRVQDLETGELRVFAEQPLEEGLRRAVWADRHRWPFAEPHIWEPAPLVSLEGRSWEIVSIDGVPAEQLFARPSLYDAICEHAGRSPGNTIDLVARDPASGELRTFADLPRRAPGESP